MEAVFRCRHLSTEADITWRVNGSSVRQFPDITTGSTNNNGAIVNILTIPATLDYNGTQAVCVAFFVNGSPPEVTPPAMLIIIRG